jgi:hypothetical protein
MTVETQHFDSINIAPAQSAIRAAADKTGRQDREQVGRQDSGDQADNNEGALPAALLDLIAQGERCCAQVPERTQNEKTVKGYKKAFVRMYASGNLDPLCPGIAFDTYYYRRAALHYGGVAAIRKLIKRILAAVEGHDDATVADLTGKLRALVQVVEAAFELEPPVEPNVLPWERPPSRFHQAAMENSPERGANSKKHVLSKLKKDWDRRLWLAAVNANWFYRDQLAVHLTVPVRPEDMVPGHRPSGWSPGVILRLLEPHRLEIAFMPSKSHDGLYGTELTTITIDPKIADEPAKYLAERCHQAGGLMVVSIESKNAVRKAVKVLGEKALPESDVTITPSVMRHQCIADLKKTFGAGEEVASAAGHGTQRTQAKYGYVQHGRKRKGYVSIISARTPRAGNVERVKQFLRDTAPHPLR